MGNVTFIVWRESVEAMLVIGILYVWLRNRNEAGLGMRFLWGGVAAGVGLAVILAFIMLKVQSELAGDALEYFQIVILMVAAALIVQMVLWMRKHGRGMKKELEAGMEKAVDLANGWGIALLAMLAVAREGAETVIFLYGMGASQQGGGALLQLSLYGALGFSLALLTFFVLSQGNRFLSWKTFFRFTEIILLLLASALLVEGVDRMIGLGWLPPLLDPVWDSSALLDDSTTYGGLFASLTGYRAHPALLVLLVYAAYWSLIFYLLRTPKSAPSQG